MKRRRKTKLSSRSLFLFLEELEVGEEDEEAQKTSTRCIQLYLVQNDLELRGTRQERIDRILLHRESNNMEVKHCFPENPLLLTAQEESGARETPSCSAMKFFQSVYIPFPTPNSKLVCLC